MPVILPNTGGKSKLEWKLHSSDTSGPSNKNSQNKLILEYEFKKKYRAVVCLAYSHTTNASFPDDIITQNFYFKRAGQTTQTDIINDDDALNLLDKIQGVMYNHITPKKYGFINVILKDIENGDKIQYTAQLKEIDPSEIRHTLSLEWRIYAIE